MQKIKRRENAAFVNEHVELWISFLVQVNLHVHVTEFLTVVR